MEIKTLEPPKTPTDVHIDSIDIELYSDQD